MNELNLLLIKFLCNSGRGKVFENNGQLQRLFLKMQIIVIKLY